eukprot:UN07131
MMVNDDDDDLDDSDDDNNNSTTKTSLMYNPIYQLQYELSQWFLPSRTRHVAEQERLAVRMALQTLAMKLY